MNLASGRRLFLSTLVVSLCATAALAIFALLIGDFGDTQAQVLITTAMISGYSLLSLPAGVLLDQGRLRPLAYAVLGLCAIAFLIAMELVWVEWDEAREGTWKTLVVVTALAGALAQISASASRRRPSDSQTVAALFAASVVGALVLAGLIALAALEKIDDSGYYRALGAVAVADLLLVLLQPIVRRMGPGTRAAGHQFACVVERDGQTQTVEREESGRDFAAAVAAAIRALEREGGRVVRIERR